MCALNVLSIDWDYFLDMSSLERGFLLPDANTEAFSSSLQTLIWAVKYAEGLRSSRTRSLTEFGLDSSYRGLHVLAQRSMPSMVPVYVANSHSSIFSLLRELDSADVRLTNVDFHHDMFNLCLDRVTCGNWLKFALNLGYVRKVDWYARKDSVDLSAKSLSGLGSKYSVNSRRGKYYAVFEGGHVAQLSVSVDSLWEKDYDLIFICKSPMWMPPHLDTEFVSVVEAFSANPSFSVCCLDDDVCDNRFIATQSSLDQLSLVLPSLVNVV